MATVKEIITAFDDAPNTAARGAAFERMMVHFFRTHPALSREYDEIHRWRDWAYNGGRPDTGIDLVARRSEGRGWTAIQCKFYSPTTTLQKPDIDSFLSESGKTFKTENGRESFTNRIVISTTDKWGRNAKAAIEDQSVPVQVIGAAQIADANLDWDFDASGNNAIPEVTIGRRQIFEPRPHQRAAIDAALEGFAMHDRGRLIMACGTGKTFTALKLAEAFAEARGGRARILFCVPSLALLGQTLREWTANTALDMRFIAVGSDQKIARAAEDIAAYDLEVPVTTDGKKLHAELSTSKRAKGLRVVFSTYHSIGAVHDAQQLGADPFDLVICDEAHRTTGVTEAGSESSAFVKVHDADFIKADKRLYMTATPRLYDDAVKDKAAEVSAELVSMDDEKIYGPEFHRLGFGEAVEKGLLTDYKVLVLAVDEAVAADAAVTAGPDGDLSLDDTSKIIGCWNGLAKRTEAPSTDTPSDDEPAPMQRAVAFARDIKTSKNIAEKFPKIIDAFTTRLWRHRGDEHAPDQTNIDLRVAADHVDGSMNALERGTKLAWLKAPIPADECRILSNARCLAEGVDVPALDAVLFLNPRNSVVDVVQSVGRVMRKSPGKDYGYIILPVGVPSGVDPATALSNNERFKVVWQVLNALRSHDDRFNAIINSAQLNSQADAGTDPDGPGGQVALADAMKAKIDVDYISGNDLTKPDRPDMDSVAEQMVLFAVEDWQQAMYTRIVARVGDRRYWEDWADDVADIASAQVARINAQLVAADDHLKAEFERFLEGLRGNLNDSITEAEAVSMLSQHLITAPVFDALFAGHDFAAQNPVSQVMQRMVDALGDGELTAETKKLDRFYESVRVRASEVTSAAGKQTVIKDLYEKFFRKAFRKQSEALGIVYTPVEIVDFILHAANDVMLKHFGKGLTAEGVHVLDPFTGTGTFIVRLLESGIIEPHDLAHKYACELHANEIMLLAYYVAAVNIETTYHALRAKDVGSDGTEAGAYEPFTGIVLADTFQMTEDGDTLDYEVFTQNNSRAAKQLEAPINVIIGNPPYSVGQANANDNNQNLKYETLDRRIEETYAARSTARSLRTLYDSYIRALRWATDRIGDRGVVAFVSNGGWLDTNTSDGIRLSLADEFTEIYVYNLRGNQRTAGEQSRKEGGKVFGSGSRATVAITIGIKDPAGSGCRIHYRDIGDYLSREQKLAIVGESTIDNVQWQAIVPNGHGDWVSQRNVEFGAWPVLSGGKEVGAQFFSVHSLGVNTGRDAWCCSYSGDRVVQNVDKMLKVYDGARAAYAAASIESYESEKEFLASHPEFNVSTEISWDADLLRRMCRNEDISLDGVSLVSSLYRPFSPQYMTYGRKVNTRVYRIPRLFPTRDHRNYGYFLNVGGTPRPFAALATDQIPNLNFFGQGGQFFPRWIWEPVGAPEGELDFAGASATDTGDVPAGQEGEILDGYRRVDNITDEILGIYREALGCEVSKDDIFYFTYGQLHDPGYRETYAADLKKMLPHIETPTDRARFDQLVAAGRELMSLHIGYDNVEPWPLDITVKKTADPEDRETWRVSKLAWKKKRDPETQKLVADKSTIVYNTSVTISGIPVEADGYQLGARSALDWVIDRWRVKTDKKSGIVNDCNDWADEQSNPRYIVDLIGKVTRVAMETNRIVDSIRQ